VAEALLRWAGELAAGAGLAQEQCRCTLQRGTNRVLRGALAEALPLLTDALSQARALDSAVEIADACQELGIALFHCGELDDAEEKLAEARRRYRTLHRIASEAQVELALGEIHKKRDEVDDAREMWARSSRGYARILSNKRAYPLINLAMLALHDDQIERARELLEEVRPLIERSGDKTLVPYCRASQALVAACDGDTAAAARHLAAIGESPPADADIASLVSATGYRLRIADDHAARKAWRLAAGIYQRLGDQRSADTLFSLLHV
jgi:tetratricopeptide (TPR) repeat protein